MWVPIGHYPHFSKLAIRLKSTALVSCSILTFVWHLLFFLASAKSLTLQRYMISLKGMKCDSIIGTELPWINSLHSIWQMLNISMFPLEIWNIPWKTLCHYNLPGWLVVQFGNHGIKARVEIGWPTSPSPWGFFFFPSGMAAVSGFLSWGSRTFIVAETRSGHVHTWNWGL